jgi:hypothetical protein
MGRKIFPSMHPDDLQSPDRGGNVPPGSRHYRAYVGDTQTWFFHANIYSYVEHDAVIGDYVTFALRVNCNGNIIIKDLAFVRAAIRQGGRGRPNVIGRAALIGMGAVVLNSVADGEIVESGAAHTPWQRRRFDQMTSFCLNPWGRRPCSAGLSPIRRSLGILSGAGRGGVIHKVASPASPWGIFHQMSFRRLPETSAASEPQQLDP